MRSRIYLLSRLLIALAIGVAFPYLEIAWKCRGDAVSSEACVWAKAHLPLTRWIEPLLVAPIAFLLITLILRRIGRRNRQSPPPRRS